MRIEHHQPRLIASPIAAPEPRGREWVARSKDFASRASSRGSFSVRRHLNAYNGYQPRRPQISAPMDFRHVDHPLSGRKPSFRPLELSIYMPENQLSPILTHFGTIDDLSFDPRNKELPAFPPSAMTHTRSESALSHHRIPRKPVRSSSHVSMDWAHKPRPESIEARELFAAMESQLPQAPAQARLRSMTAPAGYERVKSAIQEKNELEQRLRDIEETIEERKSIYMNSRPTSRATSRASRPRSIYAEASGVFSSPGSKIELTIPEPMPTPPSNPSFAERVALPQSDSRPKTAPIQIPVRHKSFSEASATFSTNNTTSPSHIETSPILPPPLPLVLRAGVRPPLRKKKSFSRVSNWLFPSDHSRNTSFDSVTNAPKPVTSRDGFYQCIDVHGQATTTRDSFSSATTVSTLETETEVEHPSPPTTYTPYSTPGRDEMDKAEPEIRAFASIDYERNEKSIEMVRVRTFGEKEMGPEETWRMHVDSLPVVPVNRNASAGRNSVGVAF